MTAPSHVQTLEEPGSEWDAFVQELVANGRPHTLGASAAFTRAFGAKRQLLAFRDATGAPACSVAIEVGSSRAVPGFRLLRVHRLGHGIPENHFPVVARELAAVAGRSRTLRINLELFEPDTQRHAALTRALTDAGFTTAPTPRSYARTILIDLVPSETEILASFHSKVRRDIRALEKGGLSCRAITDSSYADRMNELLGETMARTGGHFEPMPWAQWIPFAREHANAAQLLGVFRPDRSGPDALVAYIMGQRHGDIVEYTTAASTRAPDLRVPLLYAPTWTLMQWARNGGSTRFDFGGVSEGSLGSGDPRGGITDFKRYFCDTVTDVGGEVELEPSTVGSFVASVGAKVRQLAKGGTRNE